MMVCLTADFIKLSSCFAAILLVEGGFAQTAAHSSGNPAETGVYRSKIDVVGHPVLTDSVVYLPCDSEGEIRDTCTWKVTKIRGAAVQVQFRQKGLILSESDVIEVFGVNFNRFILFEKNSHELDDVAREILWFIHGRIFEKKNIGIGIIGHADADGSESDNLALSDQRVQSVAEYLIFLGLERWRIATRSVGEKFATHYDDPEKGLDRKVEIFFYE